MGKETIVIKYIFDSILNGINYSFLNLMPITFKTLISVLLTSAMVLLFFTVICFSVAFVYFILRDIFKNNENGTILPIIKNEFKFILNKMKNPNKDGFWTRAINKSLPFIAVIVFFVIDWRVALPLIINCILSNSWLNKKLQFELNPWLSVYLLVIFYVSLILL